MLQRTDNIELLKNYYILEHTILDELCATH